MFHGLQALSIFVLFKLSQVLYLKTCIIGKKNSTFFVSSDKTKHMAGLPV